MREYKVPHGILEQAPNLRTRKKSINTDCEAVSVELQAGKSS
jgi:hypothetical protein